MDRFPLEKPTQNYWNLTKLTEILLHHCEKYNIIIWAEFGSLIGIKRHGGAVIPWDYDGDFGMMNNDKNRFLGTFTNEVGSDVIVDVNYYYSDPGCMAFYLKDYPDDIIDIIFYEETENTINSLQNDTTKATYPSNDNYCYQKENFYPLTKTLMLGHVIYIPNKWEKVLTINYGNWEEYPEKFKNYIIPHFLRSPFLEIPKYYITNFSELQKLVETSDVPFILPKTEFLSHNLEEYQRLVNGQKTDIYGYQSSISWDYLEEPAIKVWNDYLSKNLKHNVVDAPIDDKSILPNDWNEYVKNKLGNAYKLSLTWVMTNSPKITHFHTDPEYAGGYMKLISGEKIWWCVAPVDFIYLCSKGHSVTSMAKLQMHELMQLENNYLFGKIYVDIITDGDLLWFPVNTLHKVITIKDSYGFGGYL